MQRAIIFIGCLLCLGFDLYSQIEHLRTFEDEARCRLSESNNMFVVEDFSTVGSTMKDAQYLRAVEIVNGNMVFRFSLPDLVSQEYYVLDWNISIGSREFRIAPETMSYHVIRADAQAKMYEVIWYSPFDQVPLGLEEFHVILRADFYGLPCPFAQGFEPKFGWKEQRYHFGAIAVGGALIGLAELQYMNKARDDYEKYEDLVTTEPLSLLSPQEDAEADELLERVKDNESTANFVRRSGQLIIAGSIVVYSIRYLKFKKDQKKWRRYCADTPPAIGLNPMYESNISGQSIGLSLTVNF